MFYGFNTSDLSLLAHECLLNDWPYCGKLSCSSSVEANSLGWQKLKHTILFFITNVAIKKASLARPLHVQQDMSQKQGFFGGGQTLVAKPLFSRRHNNYITEAKSSWQVFISMFMTVRIADHILKQSKWPGGFTFFLIY